MSESLKRNLNIDRSWWACRTTEMHLRQTRGERSLFNFFARLHW